MIPYHQIRALYDDATITVYQAYSSQIAAPAVASQKLSASPSFMFTRMTWIKPSWNWMMYRSGYSFKDEKQERILAIRMKREWFEHLLSLSCVTHGNLGPLSEEDRKAPVRVQWDPERDVTLAKLDHRSIQIGIGRGLSELWANEWIESIEDMTGLARRIKGFVDEGNLDAARALVPMELAYELPQELRTHLRMINQEDHVV